jgi:RNA polymerase sigma factor (sigma-70 family)
MIAEKGKSQEQSLIESYLAGDRQARLEMMSITLPIFHKEAAYVKRWQLGKYETDDIVSDLCLNFLANGETILSHWKPDSGRSFAEYIRAWAHFRTIELIRKQASNRLISMSDPKIQPWIENILDFDTLAHDADQKMDYSALLGILGEKLSPVDQQLLINLFIKGRSVSELASELGINQNSLYQRKHRLTMYIRELVSQFRREHG